jgi:hypothetical protein
MQQKHLACTDCYKLADMAAAHTAKHAASSSAQPSHCTSTSAVRLSTLHGRRYRQYATQLASTAYNEGAFLALADLIIFLAALRNA